MKTVVKDSSEESDEVKNKISTRRRSTAFASVGGEANSTRVKFQPHQNFFNDIFNVSCGRVDMKNQGLNLILKKIIFSSLDIIDVNDFLKSTHLSSSFLF